MKKTTSVARSLRKKLHNDEFDPDYRSPRTERVRSNQDKTATRGDRLVDKLGSVEHGPYNFQ